MLKTFLKAGLFTFADGQFTKSAIVDFVFSNKLPLVTTFSRENAPTIFESPIKKQVALSLNYHCLNFAFLHEKILHFSMINFSFYFQILLFATKNGSEKVLPNFLESAKYFKGKVTHGMYFVLLLLIHYFPNFMLPSIILCAYCAIQSLCFRLKDPSSNFNGPQLIIKKNFGAHTFGNKNLGLTPKSAIVVWLGFVNENLEFFEG